MTDSNLPAEEPRRDSAEFYANGLPKRGRPIPGLTYSTWEPRFGPRAGLFSVSGDPGVDPQEFDPQARDGVRLGCWALHQMMQRIEGRSPEDARKIMEAMSEELRRRWGKEIRAHEQFQLIPLAEIEPKPVEMVLDPLWPRGELIIIDGDPEAGKSWLWMAFAAGLTGSKVCPLPSGLKASKVCRILLLTSEDDAGKTMRKRLEALAADLRRIEILQHKRDEDGFITAEAEAEVLNFIDVMHRPPDVVIIDPITLYSASDPRLDPNKATHVRRLLAPLIQAARKHNFALVVARHFGKTPARSIHRGIGSIDYVAAARSVIVVGKDRQDAAERLRQVAHAKSNLVPKMRGGLQFVLDEDLTPPFQWGKASPEISADSISNPEAAEAVQEERSKKREAMEFLQQILSPNGADSVEVQKQAQARGISRSTLRRAKETLGVRSGQSGFGPEKSWRLTLPEGN